jgi:GNAT superfamily N-acetyltransferase
MRQPFAVIELRVLTPDDWQVWRQLRLAALAEAPDVFGSRLADWQGEGDREERWRARLGIPGSFNVVAVLDGQPAGMASGVPTGGSAAELISMWVSPAARGHGVGDQLVRAVERWARQVRSRRCCGSPWPRATRALPRSTGATASISPGSSAT